MGIVEGCCPNKTGAAAAADAFWGIVLRRRAGPTAASARFNCEGEVGQYGIRRRQRGDLCDQMWCYRRVLRCAGRAHEIGRDAQTEETQPCEIIFSFIQVSLNFPHLHLSSALFHSSTIQSATTARAPSPTRCAPTAVCRRSALCVCVVAELCCTFVSLLFQLC